MYWLPQLVSDLEATFGMIVPKAAVSPCEKPPDRIALSHFCYRRRKTLAPQGPRKLPKLDVAGSTPVARSLDSRFFAALYIAA